MIGEDLPTGAIRNMADPTSFWHPDRLNSPYYYTGTADNGGVHHNSGVNNKLCYLLTEGAAFNDQTVYGLGIQQVAALYYEANANLLTAAAGWADLYYALRQSSLNLGWSVDDRDNLYRACRAVDFVFQDGRCGSITRAPAAGRTAAPSACLVEADRTLEWRTEQPTPGPVTRCWRCPGPTTNTSPSIGPWPCAGSMGQLRSASPNCRAL